MEARGSPGREAPLSTRLEDLLVEAAAVAPAIADALCRTVAGADTCAAQHGIWPELRRLGLAADPQRHEEFFLQSLGSYLGPGRRVLVAGAADHGMLEMVWAAAGDARVDATVVDRCPTPLALAAWFGARVGRAVRTWCSDVRTLEEDHGYDLITSHSILRSFDAAGRKDVARVWHRLLAPGGAVVTVSRLGPHATPREATAPADRGERLAELAVAAAAGRPGGVLATDELRARVRRFADHGRPHPAGSADDLVACFEGAGFAVVKLEERELPPIVPEPSVVPGSARGGRYAELVAVRP